MKVAGHLSLLTAVLLILSLFSLRPQTFYSNDIGLRFLQARQLADSGWQSVAVTYPHQTIDPNFEHVPYYYGYVIIFDDIYFSISNFFPLLLSVTYVVLGWYGMALPMVLGGVMVATAVYLLAKVCELKRPFLWLWLAVFGTPIIFYTIQLWDHALATGFTTLGMALTAVSLKNGQPRPMAVGGALLGLALAQRPESYIFAVAAGIGLLIALRSQWRRMGWFVGGGLVGTAVSWLFNFYWTGHLLGLPLGSQVSGYGVPNVYPVTPYAGQTITPAIKMGRLLLHINARDPLTFSAALLLLVAIILIFFGLRVEKYGKTAVLWAGFGCAALAYLLWGVESFTQSIAGLLSTLPLIPIGLAYVQKEAEDASYRIYQFVFFTALLYVGLMLLIWPSFGGEQWGARYLLHAYPLLLFAAAYSLNHYGTHLQRPLSQTVWRVGGAFILLSVLFQLLGVRFLYGELYGKTAVHEEVAAMEAEVIFTNHPFLPSFLTTIEDKQFFFVDNGADLEALVTAVYQTGVRNIAVLPLEEGQLQLPNEIGAIGLTSTGVATYRLSE